MTYILHLLEILAIPIHSKPVYFALHLPQPIMQNFNIYLRIYVLNTFTSAIYICTASNPIQVNVAKRKKWSNAATAMQSSLISKEANQPSSKKNRFRNSKAVLKFIKIFEG